MRNILLLSTFFLTTFFAGAQSLTSITPNNAQKGKTLSITITGTNTSFTQTNSSVSFYQSGSPTTVISVNSFTVSNSTTISANITISASAVTGLYDAYVYDSLDGAMFLAGAFNVSNAGAKSISISPKSGTRGQTLNITITGNNTSFLQGSNTLTFFGQGTSSAFITHSITRMSATQMVASITIPPLVTIGGYSILFNTISDGQLIILNNGFTVVPPSIKSVSPVNAQRGNTLSVTITGINTHFTQGSMSLNFIDNNVPQSNLTVNFFTPTTDSIIMANVTIPVTSPLETYNLFITDSIDGILLLNNAITIQPGSLSAITPNSAARSQTLLVTITGNGTAFQQGSSTLGFFKSGTSTAINVNSIIVNSSNNLSASITIQSNAIVGVYDVRVYSPLDGTQIMYSSFTVTGPQITSVTPTILNRGTRLSLTISGTNTHFNQATGTSVYFFNQGSPTSFITVDSTKAIGATNLTAYITVSKFAMGDNIYELRAFNATDNEIIYSNPIIVAPPSITSITPNSSPNNRVLDVMLTGTGTNFTQASATNFNFSIPTSTANNIVINSVNALNDTMMKLNVTIIPTAPIGYYSLNYNSLYDGNLKTNFIISPGTPAILSVTPPTAKRGATLDVLITGQNTAFFQSSSTLSVGFMKQATSTTLININSTTIMSDNVIKLNITLDSTFSVVGTYDLSIIDSIDGALIKLNAFSILNSGINEISNQITRLNIYPNPASEFFTIVLNKQDVEVKELLITDITGRIIYESKNPHTLPDGTIRMDVHELNICKGTYFIKISTANNLYFSKLIME